VSAERRARRPGTSATRVNGPRYGGALPFRTLYVRTATLNCMRSETRSQCGCAEVANSLLAFFDVANISKGQFSPVASRHRERESRFLMAHHAVLVMLSVGVNITFSVLCYTLLQNA